MHIWGYLDYPCTTYSDPAQEIKEKYEESSQQDGSGVRISASNRTRMTNPNARTNQTGWTQISRGEFAICSHGNIRELYFPRSSGLVSQPASSPARGSNARWHSGQTVPSPQSSAPQIPQGVVRPASFIDDNVLATGYWQIRATVAPNLEGLPALSDSGIHIPWNHRILTGRILLRTDNRWRKSSIVGFRGWQNRWSSSTINF